MIWARFAAKGPGYLVDPKINHEFILRCEAIYLTAEAEPKLGHAIIDNDSNFTTEWLKKRRNKVLQWSNQSQKSCSMYVRD